MVNLDGRLTALRDVEIRKAHFWMGVFPEMTSMHDTTLP